MAGRGVPVTEQQLLLAEIIKNPEEDSVRLVYADWLQEHDDRDVAEYIRLSVETHKLRGMDRVKGKRHRLERKMWHLWPTVVQHFAPGPAGRVTIDRGFIGGLECTARDFLKHADALIWHPGMTEQCEGCYAGENHGPAGHANYRMSQCPCCGTKGVVPRSCPLTAHPIRKVVLTTWPNIEVPGVESEDWAMMNRGFARSLVTSELEKRYPGIEFVLPES